MVATLSSLTEARIRQLLADRVADPNIKPLSEFSGTQEPRLAAVLVPMLQQDDAWHLLYILRAQVEGDMHSAQVAFPGGRLEPNENSAESAALREAQEEVGLDPTEVRPLGHMEDFITISNYRVTPVIGVIPWPVKLALDSREVQRAFTIPLAWLADPANREERERVAPDGHSLRVVYFKQFDKELLWGITARITLNLMQTFGLM